MLKQSFFNV